LKCKDGANTTICIEFESISIGQTGEMFCSEVSLPPLPKINHCNEAVVKNYIFERCNGKERECMPFYRTSEISQSCRNTLKYVILHYSCGEYKRL
jgi:hypothetical protein